MCIRTLHSMNHTNDCEVQFLKQQIADLTTHKIKIQQNTLLLDNRVKQIEEILL